MIYLLLALALMMLSIFRYFGQARPYKYINDSFIVLILVITSGLVTFTPDWDGYVYWFENDLGRDLIFRALSSYFSSFNYLHISHVIVHASLLTVLCSALSGRYSGFLIFMYVSVIYLMYTTQIRFFVAYFSLCYSFYLFYFKKSYLIAGLICAFSIANHMTVLALMPLFAIIYFARNLSSKFLGYVFISAFVLPFIFEYMDFFQYTDSHLLTYISDDAVKPTLLGGMFIFAPYIFSSILLCYIYIYSRRVKFSIYSEYMIFEWVVKMAVGSMFFLPLSLSFQTFGSRFIIPALIFHLISWTYCARCYFLNPVSRVCFVFVLWILLFIYVYFIPYLFGIESLMPRSIQVFESNSLFK